MPHLNKATKEALRMNLKEAATAGSYNFLYTLAYLKHWLKEGNQRYEQIHLIRKASMQPHYLSEVQKVEDILNVQGVLILDRIVARDLAYREFDRLVVGPYEDYCIDKNGVVEEFIEADELLNKLQAQVK